LISLVMHNCYPVAKKRLCCAIVRRKTVPASFYMRSK
jgi:hypothetical protein